MQRFTRLVQLRVTCTSEVSSSSSPWRSRGSFSGPSDITTRDSAPARLVIGSFSIRSE